MPIDARQQVLDILLYLGLDVGSGLAKASVHSGSEVGVGGDLRDARVIDAGLAADGAVHQHVLGVGGALASCGPFFAAVVGIEAGCSGGRSAVEGSQVGRCWDAVSERLFSLGVGSSIDREEGQKEKRERAEHHHGHFAGKPVRRRSRITQRQRVDV